MGIASSVELARTTEGGAGTPLIAKRRWALTLSDDTLQNNPLSEMDVYQSLGLGAWGSAHPTFDGTNFKAYLGLSKVTINERYNDSPYHAEAIAEYTWLEDSVVTAPVERRADWLFETTSAQIPAFFYYDGLTQKPLVNSAGDYLEGLSTDEGIVNITIRKNFWPLNTAWIGSINHLNNATYMTCAANTLKVVGVNADYTQEFYANATYQFFAMEAKLLFRQSTHVLQIPDVGWNYLSGGQKNRCMVFDMQNGEWIASPTPMPLSNGAQTSGLPAILQRRVNPQADFGELFDTPPTDPLWPIGGI